MISYLDIMISYLDIMISYLGDKFSNLRLAKILIPQGGIVRGIVGDIQQPKYKYKIYVEGHFQRRYGVHTYLCHF